MRKAVWFVLVATLLYAPDAGAQDDPQALFAQGQELFRDGKFEESYDAYSRAWALKQTFDIAGNLGNVEVKLQKWCGAIIHLRFALANLPITMPAEKRSAAEAKINERIANAKSHVHVYNVAISPDGAAVAADGTPIGKTPLSEPVCFSPGPHKIVATLDGYDELAHDVTAAAGQEETLRMQMAKSGSGEGPVINTSGGGDTAGDDGPNYIIIIAGGVLGIGAIGAGIALHVVAGSKSNEREELVAQLGDTDVCAATNATVPSECGQISDLSDQESTFSGAGTGLLIGGGVILAATVVYWVWPRSGGDTGAVVLPTFGPSHAGLSLSGSF